VNFAAAPVTGRLKSPVPSGVYFMMGLYLVLEYTRIPSIYPFIGLLRPQLVLMLALIACWLRFGDRDDLKHPIVKFVAAFAVLCGLGMLYAPNTRASFNMMFNILTSLVAIILPLLSFVRTLDRLRWFLGLFVLSNTFIALWAFTHGGKGPGGFITDENDCALVLNVALPFAAALVKWPNESRAKRLLWIGCGVLLLLGSIATLSRGGFLGLVAAGLVAFWYSPNKLRVIGTLVVGVMIAVPLAPLILPPRYMAEIESIGDPTDSTSQNRIYFWKLGWMMYKQNPVIGVGAGNYPWTVSDYERQLPPEEIFRGRYSAGRPSHSLYFTLLPELGSVGVFIFGTLVWRVIQTGVRVRVHTAVERPRRQRTTAPPPVPVSQDEQAFDSVGRALISSCFAFLVTGAFISVLYYPSFWHLTGIAAALGVIYATRSGTRPVPAAVR